MRAMVVPSQGLRLRIASLFAGAGGLDLGFRGGFSHLGVFYERLPYETVWAVDIDRDAELTWRANPNYLPVQAFVRGDIYDQDPDSVPDFDVLLAGFPCQPFSNAGKRLGLQDPRGTLFEEVERFARAKRPKVVLLENVKGILSTKTPEGVPVTEEIRRRLERLGYWVSPPALLRSEEYGVPQRRHRVFVLALREGLPPFDFGLLRSFVKPESLARRHLREALKGMSQDLPNAADLWPFSPSQEAIVRHVKRSWKDVPDELLSERFLKIRRQPEKYRSPNFYRRFGLDEVAGTITASAQPENCGIIHPTEDRRYTVREAARIQSFPDDFVFAARSVQGKYKLVGNAVPPVLAWTIARALQAHLVGEAFARGRPEDLFGVHISS